MFNDFGNFIIFLTVFIVILFMYSHLQFEWKISNNYDILKINEPTKDEMENIYKLKQPISFTSITYKNLICQLSLTNLVDKIPKHGINYIHKCLENINSTEKYELKTKPINQVIFDLTKENSEILLMENQKNIESIINLIISNNTKLLSVWNDLKTKYLAPFCNMSTQYDLYSGTINSLSELKINNRSRQYLCVSEGSCDVIFVPPKDVTYHMINTSTEKVNLTEMKKTSLEPGDVCVIPNNWGFYIKYNDLTSIISIQYISIFHYLSNTMYSIKRYISNFQKYK